MYFRIFARFMQVCTPGIAIILSCLNLTWFARILRGALVLLARQSAEGAKTDGTGVQKDNLEVSDLKKSI